MRVGWVHPSWRDLVIEHLASDGVARGRFLRSCGINGALLALSPAGGAAGERQRPLLTCDGDWDALTDRIYALVPGLDGAETVATLALVADAIGATRSDRAEAEALARMLLIRLRDLWDAARAPIPLTELESWLTLSEYVIPEPDLPSLDVTWAELFPVNAPKLDDREELERFADWLTLASILEDKRPAALYRLGFRRHGGVIEEFLDAIEPNYARRSGSDALVRALRAASAFFPEAAVGLEIPRRPREVVGLPLEDDEIAAPRLFDVSRVLEDL